jgi:hypothetical protein
MSVILALDPGKSTGFAKLEFDGESVKLLDCGEIPITLPTDGGRLTCVWDWLNDVWLNTVPHKITQITFEEFVRSKFIPSDKEAHEVRGVIRLFCSQPCLEAGLRWSPMSPSEITSQLGVGGAKGQAARRRTFVDKVLGFKVQGRDHVRDAIAVGLAYAIRENLWQPRFELRADISSVNLSRKPRSLTRDKTTDSLTDEQIRDGIRRGTIPVSAMW